MASRDPLDSLSSSAAAAVFDRRGVLLLLEAEWHIDRDKYWSRLFESMRPGVSSVSRIAFAESLVRLAHADDDLSILTLSAANPSTHPNAQLAYRFICQFAGVVTEAIDPSPWLSLCFESSSIANSDVLAIASQLLQRILDKCKLDRAERESATLAARALFNAAWCSHAPLGATQAVVDTLDYEPQAGAELLLLLFQPGANHPDREEAIATLSRQVDKLLPTPLVVASLYEKVVTEEANEERRRKLELARWYEATQLARDSGIEHSQLPRASAVQLQQTDHDLESHAAAFLAAAPLLALRTFVSCADYWSRTTDTRDSSSRATLAISRRSFVIEAHPSDGLNRHSTRLIDKLIEAAVAAVGEADRLTRDAMLSLLVTMPAPSKVWAALIQSAAAKVDLLSDISDLIVAPTALRLFCRPIAGLIAKASQLMSSETRQLLLVGVAQLDESTDRHTKHTLELALRKAGLLHAPDSVPTGLPTMPDPAPNDDGADDDEVFVAIRSPSDADEYGDMVRFGLSREELALPANERIRISARAAWKLSPRIEAFQKDSKAADDSLVLDVDHALSTLRDAVQDPQAAPVVTTSGWCALARLASLSISISDTLGELDVLTAANRLDGQAYAGGDLLNGGESIPRALAVRGLIDLATKRTSEDAIASLEHLAHDVEPSVRFQIAWRLHELTALNRNRIWPVVVHLAEDPDVRIASAAVSELNAFYQGESGATLALVAKAFDRFEGSTGSDHEGRTDALLQLAWYHLVLANPVASAAIDRAINKIATHPAGFNRLMHSYRSWLTMDNEEGEEAVRTRTIELFKRIAAACIAALPTPSRDRPTVRQQRAERTEHENLIEDVAMQLYFASGAFRERQSAAPLPRETLARFYNDTRHLLVQIGTAGAVGAADKVLDTLEYIIASHISEPSPRDDALQRFLLVAQSAIEHGAADAYWRLDSIEKVLRRCVAQRDPSLYEPGMLAAWMRVIDPLVEHGWPQAYRLARDLDLSS
jgi:hypothetical protein